MMMTVLLSSCGEYNKILKSTDYELKYSYAKKYFNAKQYSKSATLLDELVTIFKGTAYAEESLYLLAQSYYGQKDYQTASQYFETYYTTYPKGEFTELSRFYSGYGLYLDSPDPRLDQSQTYKAIEQLQLYLEYYPQSERAEEAQSSQQTAEVKKQRTRLATAKQRVSELEVLLCKIYEDNILGKLSDSRYATLDAQYEKEQSELTAEISALEKAVKSYEKHEKDADRFVALIDKYENFDKLTIAMLNEFIEKILVHERDRKGSIQTTQEVEIYFNFVGRFVPPAFGEVELTPEELEEIRKREERKDRLHQNYLKRKANGKQKEYEERTKAKKKAEIEARKQAIRTEDIARGVFIPVSSLPQLGPRKGA